MKTKNFLFNTIVFLFLFARFLMGDTEGLATQQAPLATPEKALAPWTVLVYIAADNSLADYALYNINDMSKGLTASSNINVLVQWDKPADRKTWRYKITPGGKIDAGTTSSEMGYNPATELVNSMQWATKNYPAQHYALVLWDHGSGIEDFCPGSRGFFNKTTWLNLLSPLPNRGILYDDSQNTCLTNQGLTSALANIKKMLGKNLDLIAMDACLMAMVEVTYQMKDSVNLFVASQETIPGEGFPYSQFLRPLSLNPATTSPLLLAQNMVAAYGNFYTKQQPTSDFTLSTIDVTSINMIKQNINQFITAVNACRKVDAKTTKSLITNARRASISFEMPEYIDLYSFYANILKQAKKSTPKSSLILGKKHMQPRLKVTKEYKKKLDVLNIVIQDGLTKISKIVLQEAVGSAYSGAKGISICYPTGAFDSSCLKTLWAKDTGWIQFAQAYR